jgi:hypothetical protein
MVKIKVKQKSRMLTVRYGEKEYKAMVSHEDYEKCNQHKWRIVERVRPDGSVFLSYPMTTIKSNVISLHKYILGQIPQDKDVIDHINGDKLDNRRDNLRFLTFSENSLSFKRLQKGEKTLFDGLWWWKERNAYRVTFSKVYLGLFPLGQEIEAATRYDQYLMYLQIDESFYNFTYTMEQKNDLILEFQKECEEKLNRKEEASNNILKHIYILPSGLYQVMFRRKGCSVTESFSTLQEALNRRDDILEEENKEEELDWSSVLRTKDGIAYLQVKKFDKTIFNILVDDEVYAECYKIHWRWSEKNNIIKASIDGKEVDMHRWIWKKWKNPNLEKGVVIDHINKPNYDSNSMVDNRLEMLREASYSLNNHNKTVTNKHDYKGIAIVSGRPGWYRAEIQKNDKKYYSVNVKSIVQAAYEYNKLATELYGDNAHLNTLPTDFVPTEKIVKKAVYKGIQVVSLKNGGFSFVVKGRGSENDQRFKSIIDAVKELNKRNKMMGLQEIEEKFHAQHLTKDEKASCAQEKIID